RLHSEGYGIVAPELKQQLESGEDLSSRWIAIKEAEVSFCDDEESSRHEGGSRQDEKVRMVAIPKGRMVAQS
ncbi:unnamed protein product, partial [Effrenium voratum]